METLNELIKEYTDEIPLEDKYDILQNNDYDLNDIKKDDNQIINELFQSLFCTYQPYKIIEMIENSGFEIKTYLYKNYNLVI